MSEKTNSVLIEVSARHIHLTQEAVDVLFGKGAELKPAKNLTEPGLYACDQKIDIVGPRSTMHNVTILGPMRKYNQIELSKTDARSLGIDAPTRMSGDIEGTPGCILVGPAGELVLDKGVIVAHRHIHVGPDDAAAWGVTNGDYVDVEVCEEKGRTLVFKDVAVRLKPSGISFVHIDTDEGNAAGVKRSAIGTVLL